MEGTEMFAVELGEGGGSVVGVLSGSGDGESVEEDWCVAAGAMEGVPRGRAVPIWDVPPREAPPCHDDPLDIWPAPGALWQSMFAGCVGIGCRWLWILPFVPRLEGWHSWGPADTLVGLCRG